MSNLARLYRLATVACLVLYAVFAVVFVVAAAMHGGDAAGATVSAAAFLCAQVALGVASVGLGNLLRDRTPVLAPLVAGLLLVSAFGHAAAAGFMLAVAHEQGAGAPDHLLNPVAIPTMIGLVGGTIVLAIALFRAKLGVSWLGIVLIGWVVVEFALSGLGLWATLTSAGLLLTSFVGLAVVTARSDLSEWMNVREWTSIEFDETTPVASER
jgi:hypothetical protein